MTTKVQKLTLAAEQGETEAQYKLGCMYFKGDGVEQDYDAAFKWLTLAVNGQDQGVKKADAQHKLGFMCYRGRGIVRDLDAAFRWWTLAADQENFDACFCLGVMYFHGDGVAQDFVQAHVWLNIASAFGDEGASIKVNKIATRLTSVQINEAQELASKWLKNRKKDSR